MDERILIRHVEKRDASAWERMRQTLWPSAPDEHAQEIALFFSANRKGPLEVLIASDESGEPIGFAELSIRPYAEECYSGKVAYLEGWFVEATSRRRGVGAALVKAAEEWGRSMGCTEFASDTAIENDASAAAHQSLGFSVAGRIICFRKSL
jgi:aminoglycoside 6'-N-acetyltransferase I